MSDPGGDRRRPRLLILSPLSVEPMIHGGAVRIGNLARRLAHSFDVSMMVFTGGTDDPEQRRRLADSGIRPLFQQVPGGLHERGGDGYFAEPVVRRVRALVDAHRIDVVQLEYAELARYALCDLGAPVILVEHDLAYRARERRRAVGLPVEHPGLVPTEVELEACERAAAVVVMSEADRSELSAALRRSEHIVVVPNGVDLDRYRPPSPGVRRRGLLFVGSFSHAPNRDAIAWLADEIWPRVLDVLPDATLTVVGSGPDADILALARRPGITVAGEQPDLTPYYASHAGLVVPLRCGSGTRLKILEAFAAGLPVVSTTVGAEGIPAEPGRHLLVADDAEGFTRAISHLASDPEAASLLAVRGRQLVDPGFGWDAIAGRAAAVVGSLVAPAERPGAPVTDPPSCAVTVVVHGTGIGEGPPRALFEQRADLEWRGLWAGPGPSPDPRLTAIEACPAQALPPAGQARLMNRAMAAATGAYVVFVAAGSTITDDRWLERLVTPLTADHPPAAVQGGVTLEDPTGMTAEPHFGYIGRRWRDRLDAPVLDPANLAVARSIWVEHPFPVDAEPWQGHWVDELASVDRIVLPILDARVRRVVTATGVGWFLRGFEQGRSWAALAGTVSPLEAWADVREIVTDPAPTSRALRFGQAAAAVGRVVGSWLPRLTRGGRGNRCNRRG